MPAPPADRLLEAYRRRVAAVHALVDRQVLELFGDIDPDAIADSFRDFVDKAAPVIAAGQQSTAALAAAFMRAYLFARTGRLVDLENLDEIAGTRPDGTPIADGMGAFGPMVLGRIADGAAAAQALDFGRYLATRFADGELTSAGDRAIAGQVERSGRFRTWEGLVSQGACDPCAANAGIHPIDVPIYRHPGCRCVYVPLLVVSS